MSYQRTGRSYETILATFPTDVENLGARWFIYAQVDGSIPVGNSTLVGQEYPPMVASYLDPDSFGQGNLVVLSLKRGASVPTRPSGSAGDLTDTPMGTIGHNSVELYFKPEDNWIPSPNDLIFDVMWDNSTPSGPSVEFSTVINILRVEWAEPRFGREDVIGFWNVISQEIPFQRATMTGALRARWSGNRHSVYRRNL